MSKKDYARLFPIYVVISMNDTNQGGNPIPPSLLAADNIYERTVVITVVSNLGSPVPVTALTTLTLDGVDVLADATGTGPWEYVVPDSVEAQIVAWAVTATNTEGTDVSSGTAEVPGISAGFPYTLPLTLT